MADSVRREFSLMRLVDSMLVLDGHSDSLIRRRNDGQPLELVSANPLYHVDLPRLRQGGVDCLFCMVGDSDLGVSLELIDAAHQMCSNYEELTLCTDALSIREAHAQVYGKDVDCLHVLGCVPQKVGVQKWNQLVPLNIPKSGYGKGNPLIDRVLGITST